MCGVGVGVCVCVCVEVWGVCVIEGEVVGAVWGRDELRFRGCVFWGDGVKTVNGYTCMYVVQNTLIL